MIHISFNTIQQVNGCFDNCLVIKLLCQIATVIHIVQQLCSVVILAVVFRVLIGGMTRLVLLSNTFIVRFDFVLRLFTQIADVTQISVAILIPAADPIAAAAQIAAGILLPLRLIRPLGSLRLLGLPMPLLGSLLLGLLLLRSLLLALLPIGLLPPFITLPLGSLAPLAQ